MLMSLVMTMTISLISIYAAQVSVVEQKISANHFRAKKAFEAAEAGMDASILKLTSSVVDNLIPNLNDTSIITEANLGFDNNQIQSYTVNSGNGHYIMEVTRKLTTDATPRTRVDFKVYGFSANNTSTDKKDADQIIFQSLALTPTVGYKPPASIISLGDAVIGSNATVTNTTHDKLAALWTGGTATYDPANIDVTAGGDSGVYSKDNGLKNLRQNADSSNPDQKYLTQNPKFFENFFVESKIRFKDRSTVVDCESNGCTTNKLKSQLTFDSNNKLLNNIIWVDAYDESTGTTQTLNLDKTFSLGTADAPVILIVEGKLKLTKSSAEVFGIVYTTNDFNNNSGKGKITGSFITEGNIVNTGNMQFTYDDDTTMPNVVDSQGTNKYTRIAGTWKDF